eukprot:scaffold173323_cov14-Prasinocladus_malaysianus.AAC.1
MSWSWKELPTHLNFLDAFPEADHQALVDSSPNGFVPMPELEAGRSDVVRELVELWLSHAKGLQHKWRLDDAAFNGRVRPYWICTMPIAGRCSDVRLN